MACRQRYGSHELACIAFGGIVAWQAPACQSACNVADWYMILKISHVSQTRYKVDDPLLPCLPAALRPMEQRLT